MVNNNKILEVPISSDIGLSTSSKSEEMQAPDSTSGLKAKIKASPRLKAFAHLMLMPKNEYRPRWWVRNLWNPFKHKKGAGSVVRRRTRMDVFPYNRFELGEKSIIEDFSTVNNAVGHVLIGNKTLVGMSNVIIGPVTLGNNILLAQNVVLSGLNHAFEDITKAITDQSHTTKLITVEDGAWLGANVVVVPGVTIGQNSVVAAGSVVTKDVPPFSVVGGNPAKVLKKYNPDSKKWERNI
jgi:acetyltransferase-like isoleucine patch superfamily enzyme